MGSITIYGTIFKSDTSENLIDGAPARIRTSDSLIRRKMAKNMRGGKWRRSGKPFIVVVVFDHEPQATSHEDREVHPFVFNSKQFFKRAYRGKFTQSTTAGAKENPLHSTDNEAEAIAHLPLFFTDKEQEQIFEKLAKERSKLTLHMDIDT
jgi:hypothetical protein